jgi:8-oxo-dGTP diphosphatase
MQGIDRRRYRVVPRVLVFVRHAGRVLLMRRAPDRSVLPNLFNGLGGHVEAGEGLAEAARREVREEAGLEVREVRLAGLLHVTEGGARDGVLVAVLTAEADLESVGDSPEGALRWVRPEEAAALDLVPDLPAILPRLWPAEPLPPFLARAPGGAAREITFAGEA